MARGIGRRAFLGLLGVTPLARSGMGVGDADASDGASDANNGDPSASAVAWGSFQMDSTRTGYQADIADEPRDGFAKDWSYEPVGSLEVAPVHRGGRVYVGTDEQLAALNGSDGTEVWSKSTSAEMGLAATDSAVLVSNGTFLSALDPSDGSTVWHEEYGTHTFVYQHWEDLVFSTYGRAHDATDGSFLWETDVSPRSRYELPAADGSHIYLTKVEDVHAIDVTNGEKQWKTNTEQTLSRPTVGAGKIFTGAQHSDAVYAFDTSDGSLEWQTSTGTNDEYPPSFAVTGNSVFVSNYESVTALSSHDGSELWTYETEDVFTAPIVLGNTIYVGGRGGDELALGLIALDTASGEELAHFSDPDTAEGVDFSTACGVGGEYGGPRLIGGSHTVFGLSAGDGSSGTPALALTLADATATAGGVADVDITVSNPGTAPTTGIDIVVYVPSDDWTAAGDLPDFERVAAGASDTQTLGLNVPRDAEGEYDLLGIATDDAGNEARDDATVTVQEMSLTLELVGGSTPPGGSASVEATLENATDVATGGVRLELGDPPDGWDRRLTDAAGGTPSLYSGPEESYPTSVEWDGLDPGETVTPVYELDVPGDVEPGTFTVDASVILTRAAAVDATEPVAQDTATIEVTPGTVSLGLPPETVRPVQVVEYTDVDDPGAQHDPIPDPEMVAGRPTTVLFGIESDHIDRLPAEQEVPVRIDIPGSGVGQPLQFSLTGADLQAMADARGSELATVFQETDAEVPVFDMPPDPDGITVNVGPDGDSDGDDGTADGPDIESGTASLTAGSEFTVREQPELVVGFIEVRDPDGGSNYAGVNGDGRVGRFQDWQDGITDYLTRTLPVDPDNLHTAVEYEHIEGTTESGNEIADLKAAHEELEAYARDVLDMELDVGIAIVPSLEYDDSGRPAGGDSYFDFHGEPATVGVEKVGLPEQPQTATAVQTRYTGRDGNIVPEMEKVAATAAQEIGHHFLPAWDAEDHSDDTLNPPFVNTADRPLYPDPLAQRRGSGAGDPLDNSHARDALVSVGYDLIDGFSVLGSNGNRRPSFMSYSTDYPKWADAYAYQDLVEREFEPTPPVSKGIVETILSGVARVTDDGLEIEHTTKRRGRAQAGLDEGGIAFRMEDPTGTAVATRRISTLQGGTHHGDDAQEGDRRIVFAVPFPEETETVRATHEETGATTELAVTDVTIVEAIRRLPDRAFAGDPDERRDALLADARDATDALDDGAYDRAQNAIDTLAERVDEWVQEYEAAANQPTKEDLLTLVADLRERLDRIETVAEDAATPTESPTPAPTGTPSDTATTTGTGTQSPAATPEETTAADGSLPTWLTGAAVTGTGAAMWIRDRLTGSDDGDGE